MNDRYKALLAIIKGGVAKVGLAAVGLAGLLHGCTTITPPANTVATTINTSFNLPDYVEDSWESGLYWAEIPENETPLVELRLVIRAGAVDDQSYSGVAYLAAQALRLGSERFDKTSIDETLDYLGAGLSIQTNEDFTIVSLSSAADNFEQALAIFSDIVLSPSFPRDELDKLIQRHLAQLTQRKEQPRAVLGDYFDALVYPPNHGYVSPNVGEQVTVASIDQQSIREFYSQHYTPHNSGLILAGDFDEKTKALVVEHFSGWQTAWKQAGPHSQPGITAPGAARVWLVNKPDARETTFAIGSVGMPVGHPDYVAVKTVNTILGGRFSSWLNQALRADAGLTYGARSGFDSHADGGSFRISTFTQTVTTVEAIDLALRTYARLWEAGIDQATLDSAKAFIAGQFPPKYETSAQKANTVATLWALGLDRGYIDDFLTQLRTLTVEDLNQAIAQHFPQENLQFVFIGQADVIRNAVAQYGQVQETNIAMPNIRSPF